MTRRLEGRPLADRLRRELLGASRPEAALPHLALVRVGDDPAAETAGEAVAREAARWRVAVTDHRLRATRPGTLARELRAVGRDDAVGGVLLLRPLPREVDEAALRRALPEAKDLGVDHPATRDAALHLRGRLRPPLAAAVHQLLDASGVLRPGARVVILGWRDHAALTLAAALQADGAVVGLAPAGALPDPKALPDAVVTRAGAPRALGRASVREGGAVVDLGAHIRADGTFCGDADPDDLDGWAGALTPASGGVGPLLDACRLANHVLLARGGAAGGAPLPLFA